MSIINNLYFTKIKMMTGTIFTILSGFLLNFSWNNDSILEKQNSAIQKTFKVVSKNYWYCNKLWQYPKANTGNFIKRDMYCLTWSLYYETSLAMDIKSKSFVFWPRKNAIDINYLRNLYFLIEKNGKK